MNPLTALIQRIRNYFEAGKRWSADRSYIPGEVTDARFDADSATRTEIVRKAIYFESNNPIVSRCLDVFEQYTVGANGLVMVPASSSTEYNVGAAEYWTETEPFLDIASLQTAATLQTLSARTWANQGECFILLTASEKPPYRKRIQLIEGHRVATPDKNEYSGNKIIDGVEVNPNGRPVAYWVSADIDAKEFRRIEAQNIIHIFEPTRIGQYRGLPFWTPVLNTLHDLDDLQMLEMRAAKDASEKSTVIKAGAGSTSAEKLLRSRFSGTSTSTSGASETKEQSAYYKAVFGGRTAILKPGEDIQQFVSSRPSVAVQTYWDFLISEVCIGFGIPKLLAFPASIQGTVARADLDVANSFFQSRHQVIAAAWKRVWQYVIGDARNYDPRLKNAPADWWKVTTRPPRAVNVDVGRNSYAMLKELEGGAISLEDVCSPRGVDWRTLLKQRAREISYLKQVAAEEGIEPSEIDRSLIQTEQQQLAEEVQV